MPAAQPAVGENAPSGEDNSGLAMMASRLYPILFQYMFSAYGYSMELSPYRRDNIPIGLSPVRVGSHSKLAKRFSPNCLTEKNGGDLLTFPIKIQ